MANEMHEEPTAMEALRSELQRANEEKNRVVLEAQRAREAKDYVTDKSTVLTTEYQNLRTALAKKSDVLGQAHADEIRKLTAKHADEVKSLKDERTAMHQEIDKLQISLDEKGRALEDAEHELRKLNSFAGQDEANIRNLKARFKVANFADTSQESSQSVADTKHTAYETNFALSDVPRHKKPRLNRLVKCTQCITHNQPCDPNEPCKYCSDKKVPCKRTMCKYFKKHTCSNRTCAFAHEDDGFKNLIPFRKIMPLKETGSRKSRYEEKKELEAKYKGLFAEIARRKGKGKGKGKEGEDDGFDAV